MKPTWSLPSQRVKVSGLSSMLVRSVFVSLKLKNKTKQIKDQSLSSEVGNLAREQTCLTTF